MTQEELKQIDHPSHYNSPQYRCECIEAMVKLFGQEKVNIFSQLCQFKYVWRAGLKIDELEDKDLRKSQWYYDYAMNHKEPDEEIWSIGEMREAINKMFLRTKEELDYEESLKQKNDKNNK